MSADVGPTGMNDCAYFQFIATTVVPMNEWRSAEHASAYLERADRVPHRSAGEAALLEEIPLSAHRVLDLGSGDGRLLELVLRARPTHVA